MRAAASVNIDTNAIAGVGAAPFECPTISAGQNNRKRTVILVDLAAEFPILAALNNAVVCRRRPHPQAADMMEEAHMLADRTYALPMLARSPIVNSNDSATKLQPEFESNTAGAYSAWTIAERGGHEVPYGGSFNG